MAQQRVSDSTVAFTSGLFAGFTSTVLLHPLDLIKTRFQVDEASLSSKRIMCRLKLFSARAGTSAMAAKNIEPQALTTKALHSQIGMRGFYRGLVPALIGSCSSWALYWLLYEKVKIKVAMRDSGAPDRRLSTWEYLLSSMSAGCVTTMCTNPIWLIKTRMELQVPGNEAYKGFLDAIYTIFRQDGVAGFYKGIVPALFLCSNGAVQFAIYEELKNWASDAERKLSPYDFMLLGAISKSIASTITYPYQVVKSRMQQHQSRYGTTWFTLREIIAMQGVSGLFRGLVPNVLRVMPASAITFMTYEQTKSFLIAHK